jgi:CHAD domain-containing protein
MMLGAYAQSFARVVRARQAVRADDPSTVHRLRVAFKRFRYMSEVLQPLLPWLNPHQRKAMQAYQTAMGEIQDLEVLTSGVRTFAASMPLARRISMLPVQEVLALRRKEKIDAFLQTADALGTFWSDAH